MNLCSLKGAHSHLFFRIHDNTVDLFASSVDPPIVSYCSFNDHYLDEITVNSDEAIVALVNVEDAKRKLKPVGNGAWHVDFLGGETERATKLRVLAGGLQVAFPLSPNAIINYAEQEEIRFDSRLETFKKVARERWEDLDHGGEVRAYPSDLEYHVKKTYLEEHDNLSEVTVPLWLYERFDRNNNFVNPEGEPPPTKVETTVEQVQRMLETVDKIPEAEGYSIGVKDGEFLLEVGDDEYGARGQLGAFSVEGPDVKLKLLGLEENFESLSGRVTLYFLPDEGSLAVVQRDKGRVIRHSIGAKR